MQVAAEERRGSAKQCGSQETLRHVLEAPEGDFGWKEPRGKTGADRAGGRCQLLPSDLPAPSSQVRRPSCPPELCGLLLGS